MYHRISNLHTGIAMLQKIRQMFVEERGYGLSARGEQSASAIPLATFRGGHEIRKASQVKGLAGLLSPCGYNGLL